MSGDFAPLLGECQGNLATPTTSTRERGKVLNFAVGYPDPAVACRLASYHWVVAYALSRQVRYDRLVEEIGPWMLARRRERTAR